MGRKEGRKRWSACFDASSASGGDGGVTNVVVTDASVGHFRRRQSKS